MIDSPFISVTRLRIPPFAVGMRAFHSKGLFSTRGTERRRSKQCVDSGEGRSAGTRLLGRYRADSFKAEHLSHYTSGRRRMPHIFTMPTRRDLSNHATIRRVTRPAWYSLTSIVFRLFFQTWTMVPTHAPANHTNTELVMFPIPKLVEVLSSSWKTERWGRTPAKPGVGGRPGGLRKVVHFCHAPLLYVYRL